jgi:PAS domain S-box-containing protein
MKDQSKTKQALIKELASLRQRIQEFERSGSERKCEEDALRESEEKYRAIIENMQEGYHEVDLKGNFTFFNESACRMLGYEREELLGMNNRQYSDEENARKIYQVYNRVYRTGEPVKNFEWQIIRKDGDRRDIEVSISLIRDAGGHPAGFRGIVRDITERKRTEAELRKTHSLLSSITEGSTDAIYIKDIQGRYLLFNKEAARVTGKKPEEVIGKDDNFLFPADEAKKVMDGDRRVMETGQVMTYEEVVTTTDGKLTYLSTKGSVYNDEGKVSGLFGIARDITERKQAEEALRNLSQFNHEVISGAAEGIVVYDRELHYLVWNRFMEALTGVPACDVLGQSALDVFPHLREQGVDRLLERALAGETARSQDTPFHSPATGRSGWVMGTYAPHRNGDGVVIGVIATIQDITERKRAEVALKKSEEKYRLIAENMADVVSVLDMNLRFTYVSPSIMFLRGFTVEEAMKQTLDEVMTLESLKIALTAFEEEMKLEASGAADPDRRRTMEVEEYRKDGSIIWVEINLSYMRDENHKAVAILAMTRDITARKQAEEKFREAHRRLDEIIEFLPDATCVIDADGKVIAWNRAAERMTGVPKAEMIGKGEYEYALPFYGERRPVLIDLALLPDAELEKRRYDIAGRSVDTIYGDIYVPNIYGGKGAYLYGAASRLRDAAGNIVGAIESIRDITELKQAEEARRKSEERFKLSMEATNDGLWDWDIKTDAGYFSPMYYHMLGYEVGDFPMKGNSWRELIHPDDCENALRMNMECIEGRREHFEVEFRMKAKNGEWHWIMGRGKCVMRDEQGHALRLVGTHVDITGRKLAEAALRESEERFRNLYQESPIPTFTWQRKEDGFILVDFNKAAIQMTNGKVADIRGKSAVELYGNRPQVLNDMNLCYKERSAITRELTSQHFAPGRFLFVNYGFIPPDLIIVHTEDQTEHKHAEEALRESEDKYRSIFENAVEGFFQSTPAGSFLTVNPAFARIFGYASPEELISTISDISQQYYVNHEDRLRYMEILQEKGAVQNFEFKARRKDGAMVWVSNSTRVIVDEGGNIIRYDGIVEDITERKQMEEEKQSLQERLQRAEKMEALGTMAGGVAHDLNNVLGVVIGYAEMLLMDADESKSASPSLVNIMNGAQRAAAIVQDLLTLARRGVSGREVLNLNKIIADCQKSPEFEKLFSYHPFVRIKADLEPDLLNISGSSVHLGKTLFNLVSNASEAMPKGGILTIKTANRYLDRPIQGYDEVREGDYVVLSVSDTGEGIPAADLKRIFEPFYTKKVMGRSGTGLGLAVVWGTVKDHNGYINVESEEGKGSTFTLYFPVTREDITAEAAAISISEYMGKGESILVVDDVKEQRDLAAGMLRKLNYNVSSVSSGEEAVAYLKEHKIDLLVLDMIMDPGMDGLDTYKEVLEIHPQQKALIVSGFSESDRVITAQDLGAGAYVRKPYVIEKLGLAVKKEVDRK